MRDSALFALAVVWVGIVAWVASPARAQERPNIVLFIVDDLGWQDTSVAFHRERTAFNERYRTPHLERLAERSVRFGNAYASAPVCTPTRTAILTGKAPARTRITYWTLHKDTDTSRPREDIAAPPWAVNGLQPGEHATLPELLREAGYRTIHVGKAHFGAHGTRGSDPGALGFDVNVAGHGSGAPGSFYGVHRFSESGRRGDPAGAGRSVWDVPGLEAYHGHDVYLTEALAIEAGREIRDAAGRGVPFFLHFAPYAVHTPIMGNAKYERHYPDLDERERAYASMIETYDAALGGLVAALEQTGQLERTVIIFTSDNGGLSAHARGATPDGSGAHHHNAPLRSGKGSAYEGGTRVPTLIAWPGVTDEVAERLVDAPIVSHDLFPTMLRVAGVTFGAEGIDGRDLTPLLRGGDEGFLWERTLGWHQPHQWGADGPGIRPFTSIRRGDHKLIYFHAGRRFELYDLGADIGEARDLAADNPGLVAELAGVMDEWIVATGAQLSVDKETGRPIEMPSTAAQEMADRTRFAR